MLLANGGDATYLCHWMRESGLADLLPSLPEKVWVGVSAGSMVMTPRIGADDVSETVHQARDDVLQSSGSSAHAADGLPMTAR